MIGKKELKTEKMARYCINGKNSRKNVRPEDEEENEPC